METGFKILSISKKFIYAKLLNDADVQECDATGDAICNADGLPKIF